MAERPLPATDRDTIAFWTGGERGELLIERCRPCGYYIHPPTGFCPRCESRDTAPEPVSGRGTVTTFTVNHKQWMPDLPVPYVLALVTIAEQDDVRLATNIVDCAPEHVAIGMEVQVRFERNQDLWVPLFAPVKEAGE
ncbi:MAG: OB-fold domain-containing protein [Novosphingobium sp.]|nr:OB-fold domain-containing protein [Novosphingobium sp.]